MPLPNFLIIGAAKAATTSLYDYLSQHPGVFASANKEPGFFAFEGGEPPPVGPGDDVDHAHAVTEIAAYEALFADAGAAAAIGEASTVYLAAPAAPERIRAQIPRVRLVAILRDPSERAFSSFLHLVRDRRETTRDFRAALDLEDERTRAGWAWLWRYREMGLYATQVRRYLETFDRAQLCFHLYEDFRADPARVLRDTFEFLGVDPSFAPDTSARRNVSRVVRRPAVHGFLTRPSAVRRVAGRLLPLGARRRVAELLYRRNFHRPRLDPALRRHLIDGFRADILELQDLLGRDLGAWLR